MSRPAPLEVYITAPELVPGGSYHAMLFDPARDKVLLSTNAIGYDTALERLLLAKRMSRVARRRFVVKSSRPPAVLSLLGLIDIAQCTQDADNDQDATFLPLSMEEFLTRIRGAITAIEQGAKAVVA